MFSLQCTPNQGGRGAGVGVGATVIPWQEIKTITSNKCQEAHVNVWAEAWLETPEGLLAGSGGGETGKGETGKGYFFEQPLRTV